MLSQIPFLVSLQISLVLVVSLVLVTSVRGSQQDWTYGYNDQYDEFYDSDVEQEEQDVPKEIFLTMPGSEFCGKRPVLINRAEVTSNGDETYRDKSCILKFQADEDFFTSKKIIVNLTDVHITDCSKEVSVYFDDHTYGIPDYVLDCHSPDYGVVKSTFRFVSLKLSSPLAAPDYFNIVLTVYDPDAAVNETYPTIEPIAPGFRTRITQKALDFATTLAVDVLMSQIQYLDIPDIQETIGTTDVSVNNIKIMKFPRPTATFVPHPGSGISLQISDLNIKVTAEYEAEMGLGFFGKIQKSGTVVIKTEDMSFTIEIQIGVNRYTGQPNTITPLCYSAGDLIITFTGGWADMLNVGSSVFGNTIRSLVASQVCSTVQAELDKNLDSEMGHLPMNQTITNGVDFKFGMTELPFITDKFVETSHMGTFTHEGNEPSFEPAFIPEFLNHTEKMAYVYVTDYVLNTAFIAAFQSGLLKYYVTKGQLPEQFRSAFDASCLSPEFCIGVVFPGLPARHPHGTVEISVSANDAPNVTFYDGNAASVKASVTLEFFVRENGQVQPAFALNFSIAVDAAVNINDGKVSGDLRHFDPQVEVLYSHIGDVGTNFFYETLLRVGGHIAPMFLEKGFALPTSTGVYVEILNPEVIPIPEPGVFVVATDISVNLPEGLNLIALLGPNNATQDDVTESILDDADSNLVESTTHTIIERTTRPKRGKKRQHRRRRPTTPIMHLAEASSTEATNAQRDTNNQGVTSTEIATVTKRMRKGKRRRKERRLRSNVRRLQDAK